MATAAPDTRDLSRSASHDCPQLDTTVVYYCSGKACQNKSSQFNLVECKTARRLFYLIYFRVS